jgi:2'-5' RNA ligase
MSSSSDEGYAIELYMDPALENQVLKAWNVLARRQISTELIEIGSRPHITLFSTPYLLEPSKLESILKTLTSKFDPFSLSFSSISSFSNDNNTLFLSPTPSISLLNFHSNLVDSIVKEGIEVSDEFAVGNWIPHCEVANHVPKSRIAEAFTLLRDLKLPVTGYAVDVARVQFNPVREIFSFVLGNNNNNIVEN